MWFIIKRKVISGNRCIDIIDIGISWESFEIVIFNLFENLKEKIDRIMMGI